MAFIPPTDRQPCLTAGDRAGQRRPRRIAPVRALGCLWFAVASFAGAQEVYVDHASEWGLDFVHFNGMSGEHYFPEMTGQGGALFDYDLDGDLDVFFVQGTALGPGKTLDNVWPQKGGPVQLGDRLFRNDLAEAEGSMRPHFVDVTEQAGALGSGYGMGAAVGDFDNDGAPDLYVTRFGTNQLLRNLGDGTFEDVTAMSGTGDDLWSTSAAFLDADNDGRLDLYVANYVEFDLDANPACYAANSSRDYCGPQAFRPQPDRLYRNLGDGRFEDATLRLLVGYRAQPALGVRAQDINEDGRIDIFVANDGTVNQHWISRGESGFSDEALLAGTALNRAGQEEASMGVDAGDFDGDGDPDLFAAHLTGETHTLYVNDGSGLFEDRSVQTGLAVPSVPFTGFGAAWTDFDSDGWLDLLVANGAVTTIEEQTAAGVELPLGQPNQLFRNLAGRAFEEVPAGPDFLRSDVSRGLAVGDIDNDGDADALVFNNRGPARLLINKIGSDSGWLAVAPSTGALGLQTLSVTVETSGARSLRRFSHTDGSYCSASDDRVQVGLGSELPLEARLSFAQGPDRVWKSPPSGRYLVAAGLDAYDRPQ